MVVTIVKLTMQGTLGVHPKPTIYAGLVKKTHL